jgi:ABC-type nitrate/sulfonate/bicarbonate transport system substrate-binding protein
MKSINIFISSLLVVIVSLTACVPKSIPTAALTPITVQLAWTHNAQFAGMYVANQKGYYASEGLAVTFAQGGPTTDSIEAVLSGKIQLGIGAADAFLIACSTGKPVSAIAVIYRRSSHVYVALAGSEISRPQDFVGKIISMNATGHAPFEALMKRVGILPDQYTLVDSTPDLSSFYSGKVRCARCISRMES